MATAVATAAPPSTATPSWRPSSSSVVLRRGAWMASSHSPKRPLSLRSGRTPLPFSRGSSGVGRGRTSWSTHAAAADKEEVYFDGGPHIGDLVANLVFGLSLLWLPLTLAAVVRALFLRYRFTNLRVTVLSGLTGGDRKDFSYSVVRDVKYVPRFVGEWGDIVITLSDGTQVELKSVPKFREIAKYCLERAEQAKQSPPPKTAGKGMSGSRS